MKMRIFRPFLAGVLSAFFLFGLNQAAVAASHGDKIDEAIANKNLEPLRGLVSQHPEAVDDVVRALLKSVQDDLTADPDFAQREILFASSYAPQITPPVVPPVCADMRRIVEALPANQAGTSLSTAVMNAAQSFANAPVVVASGRPNLCEEAWLQEALLAQSQGYRQQGYIRPIPPPPVPPSAD